MISDMRVVETGTHMVLSVERDVAASLAERLDKLIFSEDVQVQDVSTGELNVIGVHGPSAAAMIQSATGASVADLASEYDNVTVDSLTIVRDSALALPGFDIHVAASDAMRSVPGCIDAGAVNASEETYETLRIEAGRPRFGLDMNTDTIPLEAGIEDRAISFTKGLLRRPGGHRPRDASWPWPCRPSPRVHRALRRARAGPWRRHSLGRSPRR